MQAPFLYDYSGAPWKTQARVRELLADAYRTTPAGIPGNDDCGTMSAWYVFAALGLYPTDPARPAYELCAPLFPRAVVHLDAPYPIHQFTIEAPDTSAQNVYLRGLRVGDQSWTAPWLTQADIAQRRHAALHAGRGAGQGMGPGAGCPPAVSWALRAPSGGRFLPENIEINVGQPRDSLAQGQLPLRMDFPQIRVRGRKPPPAVDFQLVGFVQHHVNRRADGDIGAHRRVHRDQGVLGRFFQRRLMIPDAAH